MLGSQVFPEEVLAYKKDAVCCFRCGFDVEYQEALCDGGCLSFLGGIKANGALLLASRARLQFAQMSEVHTHIHPTPTSSSS